MYHSSAPATLQLRFCLLISGETCAAADLTETDVTLPPSVWTLREDDSMYRLTFCQLPFYMGELWETLSQ